MEADAKERILQAADQLLNETEDMDTVTVRQIAERASVGIGLVNYYYQSKNHLFGIVIGRRMEEMVLEVTRNIKAGLSPVEKLRKLLKDLCSMGEKYDKQILQRLKQCMINGDLQAEISLIPLLREIYGSQYEEMQLRLVALQLIAPIQAAVLSTDSFQIYSGYDLTKEEQRNRFIDQLIDCVIGLSSDDKQM